MLASPPLHAVISASAWVESGGVYRGGATNTLLVTPRARHRDDHRPVDRQRHARAQWVTASRPMMVRMSPWALRVARDASVWAISGRRATLAISVRLLTAPALAPIVLPPLDAAANGRARRAQRTENELLGDRLRKPASAMHRRFGRGQGRRGAPDR
jgi:hypothetical protein